MVGLSFVPVIVIVTSWSRDALAVPELSVTVSVYLTVTTSPSARYCVSELATVKSQVTVPSWVAVLSPPRVRAPAESRAASRSSLTVPPLLPTADVKATVVSERSVSSRSAKSIEPEATSWPAVASSSTRSAATDVAVMVGLSFVPVIVTTTWRVTEPAAASLTVTS